MPLVPNVLSNIENAISFDLDGIDTKEEFEKTLKALKVLSDGKEGLKYFDENQAFYNSAGMIIKPDGERTFIAGVIEQSNQPFTYGEVREHAEKTIKGKLLEKAKELYRTDEKINLGESEKLDVELLNKWLGEISLSRSDDKTVVQPRKKLSVGEYVHQMLPHDSIINDMVVKGQLNGEAAYQIALKAHNDSQNQLNSVYVKAVNAKLGIQNEGKVRNFLKQTEQKIQQGISLEDGQQGVSQPQVPPEVQFLNDANIPVKDSALQIANSIITLNTQLIPSERITPADLKVANYSNRVIEKISPDLFATLFNLDATSRWDSNPKITLENIGSLNNTVLEKLHKNFTGVQTAFAHNRNCTSEEPLSMLQVAGMSKTKLKILSRTEIATAVSNRLPIVQSVRYLSETGAEKALSILQKYSGRSEDLVVVLSESNVSGPYVQSKIESKLNDLHKQCVNEKYSGKGGQGIYKE